MGSKATIPMPVGGKLPRAMLDRIESAFLEVIDSFSPVARKTLLFENRGKHLYEIRQILGCAGSGARILDVGGGVGVNLLVLAKLDLGLDLQLIDRFEEYSEDNRMGDGQHAIGLLKRAGVRVVSGDFWGVSSRLDFKDNAFDIVTCYDVIEHLPGNPLSLLVEARRILRSDGAIMLGVPNAVSTIKRLKLLAGIHPYINFDSWCEDSYYGHFREYTAMELAKLLEQAGFDVEATEFVCEPTRTRARYGYQGGQGKSIGKKLLLFWAVQANYFLDRLCPGLRASVYSQARPKLTASSARVARDAA